jgi:pimeloyl-ACP methyl ester carboxylesterase
VTLPADMQASGAGPPAVPVHGSASGNRQWQKLAARKLHWDFERLDGCGHMAPLTQAERVNDRLVAFLHEASPVAAAA